MINKNNKKTTETTEASNKGVASTDVEKQHNITNKSDKNSHKNEGDNQTAKNATAKNK